MFLIPQLGFKDHFYELERKTSEESYKSWLVTERKEMDRKERVKTIPLESGSQRAKIQ